MNQDHVRMVLQINYNSKNTLSNERKSLIRTKGTEKETGESAKQRYQDYCELCILRAPSEQLFKGN